MAFLTKSRQLHWGAVGAAVLVLWALVAGLTWPVRAALRDQVLRREAEAVAAVARLQRDLGAERMQELGIEPTTADTFDALLDSARLEHVVAIQLFGAGGRAERELPAEAWVEKLPVTDRVTESRAVLHPVGEAVPGAGDALQEISGPWLEVVVPLADKSGGAVNSWARYWIDGKDVAAEMVALDRHLALVSGVAAGVGGLVLGLGLSWAFAQMRRQAEDLRRTNRELLLHTKSAAIGAISAHLLHGLNNPVAGLEGFMAEGVGDGPGRGGEAWREAAATTQRVRRMINDVLAVLREEADGEDYSVSVSAVVEEAATRVRRAAEADGLVVSVEGMSAGSLVTGRTAALAGLVMQNLLDNAMAATPAGGRLTIRLAELRTGLVSIDIADTGSGLPEAVRRAEFAPVASGKPGGAGLGLALSRQLARHAGGALDVVESGPNGTRMRIVLPVAVDLTLAKAKR